MYFLLQNTKLSSKTNYIVNMRVLVKKTEKCRLRSNEERQNLYKTLFDFNVIL